MNDKSDNKTQDDNKNYSKNVALFLCFFPYTGMLGIHDLYLGRFGWFIIKFLTCNLLLVGWIYDIYQMLKGEYKFSDGSFLNDKEKGEYKLSDRSSINDKEESPSAESTPTQHSETEQKVDDSSKSQVFDLLKGFDDAVDRRDEDDAIIFGGELLQQDISANLMHIFLGFKKLALDGFEDSKTLYVSLALRFITSLRNEYDKTIFFVIDTNIKELNDAIAVAHTINDANNEKIDYINRLQGELMCWHWIGSKHFEHDDEAKRNDHLISAKNISESIKNEGWAKEYIELCPGIQNPVPTIHEGTSGDKLDKEPSPAIREDASDDKLESNNEQKNETYLMLALKETEDGFQHIELPFEYGEDETCLHVDYSDGTVFIDWQDGSPRKILGYYEKNPDKTDIKNTKVVGLIELGYTIVYDATKEYVIGYVGDNELIWFCLEPVGTMRDCSEEKCLADYESSGGIYTACGYERYFSNPISPHVGLIIHNNGTRTKEVLIGGAAAFVATMYACNFRGLFNDYFRLGDKAFQEKYPEINPFA